ncbi:MAG: hypothetical protein R6V86_11045 [Spirochaetia bacterium]
MRHRIVPSIACMWEVARYILLVQLLHMYLNPLQSMEYRFFFFWLLSYSFASLLGTALPAVRPQRFWVVARVVGVAKLLQVAAGLLFLLYEVGIIPVLLNYFSSTVRMGGVAALFANMIPLLVLITMIDLITAVVLIKYKPLFSTPKTVPVDITEVETNFEE